MPSAYCRQNPFSNACLQNPNATSGSNVEIINYPSIGGGESGNIKIISNTGGLGVYQNQTTLDKALATALSAIALLTRQGYVPTTEQPKLPQFESTYRETVNPNTPAQDNIGGQITEWVKQNSTVVIIGGLVGVAYLVKSPRSSKR